jgi:EAL domain-containing protein (putative c-di-GMP-specific phosphodiesterase class I)
MEVGVRIKSCVREMDTVARFGGDEFVVLVEAVSNDMGDATHKVALVGEKIREALAQSYKLKEHEHHSSPSIGISLYHGHDESMDTLIEQADMAMYQVKNAGRNGVRFFDPVMQHKVAKHDALDNDLHYAIALQQLHLHYQIQVDKDNRPLGAEAFLRWMHPERGMIMPSEFLPIAEESTLINDIGHWVMQTACHQLALWSRNEKTRDLTLTVNISAKHFAKPDFVSEVAEIVKSQQADPTLLKLELSERLVMTDMSSTMEKIQALRNMGIRLSMDNFGTVYSSLSFLRQLSADQLKIHQEFVQGITLKGNDAQLIRAVIDLAKSLDLGVFAEGVETEEQRDFLKSHDCNVYQGYLFSKPVPIEHFEALVA